MHLEETRWETADWIHLAQRRDQWHVLVNTVVTLRLRKTGNLLTSSAIISFSKSSIPHEVSFLNFGFDYANFVIFEEVTLNMFEVCMNVRERFVLLRSLTKDILSLGVKRPECEADHSTPSSAEVKDCVDIYLHSPIRLHGVVFS
jgi:hypothetical protein